MPLRKIWNQEIDIGYHNSGDVVKVKVLDADSGLEFGDDLLYSTTIHVPWCSAFHADVATAECDDGYDYECDVNVGTVDAIFSSYPSKRVPWFYKA